MLAVRAQIKYPAVVSRRSRATFEIRFARDAITPLIRGAIIPRRGLISLAASEIHNRGGRWRRDSRDAAAVSTSVLVRARNDYQCYTIKSCGISSAGS